MYRVMLGVFTLLACKGVYAFNINLGSGEWYMLTVPGDTEQSIEEAFSSSLSGDEYGETWSLFVFDSEIGQYVQPPGTATLPSRGEAFWIVQETGSVVPVSIPDQLEYVQLTRSSICPTDVGCFEYPLPTGEGATWSMIGSPFIEGVYISELIVKTDAGPCFDGCSLAQASQAGLTGETFFAFNRGSEDYTELSTNDILMPGDGHWFRTSISSEYGSAQLIIANYCT